jgi:hypothetical protein
VYLGELRTVFEGEGDIGARRDPPLLGFGEWTSLKEEALKALRYRDIPLEYVPNGLQAAIAYLEWELKHANLSASLNVESGRPQGDRSGVRLRAGGGVGFQSASTK